MRRLGMRGVIVLVLAAALSAVGAPADAWSTSVSRTPQFDFGCQFELYGNSTRNDGRCRLKDDAARQGHLRSRRAASVRIHSLSLLNSGVEKSTLSNSTGVIVNPRAPSNVVVTVVARGTEASVSVFSGLRLCLTILSRSGDGHRGACQPMGAGGLTTMRDTFEGFRLDSMEGPYRLVVFLQGSGRADVVRISYRLQGATAA